MTIRVGLHHKTHYRYDRLIAISPQIVRLRPAPHTRTPILSYSLKIQPKTHFINWQQDPYSNYLARLVFPERAEELSIEVDLVADMSVINPFDFFLESYAEKYPFAYDAATRRELSPYLEVLTGPGIGPKFAAFLEGLRRKGLRTIDYLVEINGAVKNAVKYLIRLEPGVQSPEETLTLGSGSCRDSAWLQVQAWRHLGIASRFVSGYLIQLCADEKSLDGPSGPEKDFTDLHAWTEVYLPGAGWVGLDATSGLLTGEGHIPLACTAEPASAAPISGAVDECETEFDVEMSVRRVFEDPRVTKPYSQEQWQRINEVGQQIDKEFFKNGVRLTMGGEPTFVSIDDMAGAEWNNAAHGAHKHQLAGELLKRLRNCFAPGALLHYGQGKWYPGESLPRWAMGCYWRKDGQPVWRNPALIADGSRSYGADATQARTFITALAQRLGVGNGFVIPAYEDAFYYLWKEQRLPVNVDAAESRLKNAEDRARLARVFEQGLSSIVGHVLPLRASGPAKARWESGAWHLRSEHLFLLPGDSPLGFRLPLDSLGWVAEKDADPIIDRDPMEERSELPTFEPTQRQLPGHPETVPAPHGAYRAQELETPSSAIDPSFKPERAQSAAWVIRTALCVEPRNGRLHVFMPPLRAIEDYFELVAQVEATAADLKLPVLIEGYTPPHDPRVNVLKVTPDPGVIEVNTHPVDNWEDLAANTLALYEEARLCRLGTEKFMLDGRHTGTGGGNHIVVGGATPQDSPFIRRPDLLRSLVAYWHNHPSLTYLFSSTFIGPTSQAPRADEGRPESVYELELAFAQIPNPGQSLPSPWLVDRVFRNLLVDLTGNTHRAEFCIDKLYSPDTSTGRLGLVEFRGFEMPPHARMSLAQHVLLRGLIAKFWKEPYTTDLVRWGTQLHDRFMLPHFVQQDFSDVISDLRSSGLPMELDWFAPHIEFRFPRFGSMAIDGIQIELRQAIEPWYVLGEEPAGGATARYVDSSVERLQVKVEGLIGSRHAIGCNGIAVPLHPTGRNGEFVAGIRYRAWQPPSCLHPTIGVHTPLVFDLVDTWNHRALGGCSYYVSHPGGMAFEDYPVNAWAAETRRGGRFTTCGHTPGQSDLKAYEKSLEFPLTLDLRRV